MDTQYDEQTINKMPQSNKASHFWEDPIAWKRAVKNTTTCLIGCSIGDFGTIIYMQHYFPEISIWLVMPLAMIAGLITSIALETVILKIKEGFIWKEALRMAFAMSFISMVGMELAENTTDYLLTKGTVAMSDPWYWWALGISLIAGFFAPLPYNYYKFKKHGKSCH